MSGRWTRMINDLRDVQKASDRATSRANCNARALFGDNYRLFLFAEPTPYAIIMANLTRVPEDHTDSMAPLPGVPNQPFTKACQ